MLKELIINCLSLCHHQNVILIALMAGFLAVVIFMIIINDRPFYGRVSISPEPYQLILDRVIDKSK